MRSACEADRVRAAERRERVDRRRRARPAVRAITATRAPSAARHSAAARPMPFDPPLTTTAAPASSRSTGRTVPAAPVGDSGHEQWPHDHHRTVHRTRPGRHRRRDARGHRARACCCTRPGLPTRYYLPRDDVRMDRLNATDMRRRARSRATPSTGRPRSATASSPALRGATRSRSTDARTSPASSASSTSASTRITVDGVADRPPHPDRSHRRPPASAARPGCGQPPSGAARPRARRGRRLLRSSTCSAVRTRWGQRLDATALSGRAALRPAHHPRGGAAPRPRSRSRRWCSSAGSSC